MKRFLLLIMLALAPLLSSQTRAAEEQDAEFEKVAEEYIKG